MKRKARPQGTWWEKCKGSWHLVSHDVCWGVVYRVLKGRDVWSYVNQTLCGPDKIPDNFTGRTAAMDALRKEVGQ